MTWPKVSVVVPLFNKAPYVREAVESALAQDCEPLEVIVVDDGSTDGGATALAGLDERVKVVTQPNAGVSVARNRGIAEAKGDWIAFLDADDRFLPGHLGTLVDLHRQFPEAAVLCNGYRCFWPDGRTEDRILKGKAGSGLVLDFYQAWRRYGFTCTSSILVTRASLLDFEFPFPVGERLGEDQDLWFRLAERWPVAFASRVGAEYRMDVSGSATAQDAASEFLPCYVRLAERIDSGMTPKQLQCSARRLVATHYLNVARQCLRQRRFYKAMELIGSRRAMARPSYWLQTAMLALATRCGLVRN